MNARCAAALLLLAAPALASDAEDLAQRERRAAGKTQAMITQHALLRRRYDFSGRAGTGTMSAGKALMEGPIARATTEFAYPPLPHPAPEAGHFVFPGFYGQLHPEFARVDADFDLPEAYLPEYPPPLYLTTRPDLGDVSGGHEITPYNFKALLEGVLTPQQLEGLRLLLLPRNTLGFNASERRLTAKPSHGVSCFSCHVNGHTNAAILAEPSTRPNAKRARLDTPSLRGVAQARVLSAKRGIPNLTEFSHVEDYFEGETAAAAKLGALKLTREDALAMTSFMALIDYPPAPKLGPEARLEPRLAGAEELKGQALFFGKAKCATCHPAPNYSDGGQHDLRVERLSGGPIEGSFKTPTLRGVKDSPPYLHDGRLPTLEDAVAFIDLVLGLKLRPDEKRQLVAFLKTL